MLSEITVDKSQLIDTLRKNRENHLAIVKEAQIGYVEDARRVFEEKLKLITENKIVSLSLGLSPPVDNTREYDQAISMLEWEKSSEICLSQQSFKNFVLDDWSWKNNFLISNAKYSPIGSGCAFDAGLL
jgi:hypothetical protein